MMGWPRMGYKIVAVAEGDGWEASLSSVVEVLVTEADGWEAS